MVQNRREESPSRGYPESIRELWSFRAPETSKAHGSIQAGFEFARPRRINWGFGGQLNQKTPPWRGFSGASKQNRTVDLFITSETLYQLSYGGLC